MGDLVFSDDGLWAAELYWTDKPENLGWFVHKFQPDGVYDNLSVEGFYDYTGQSAADVLKEWKENPQHA